MNTCPACPTQPQSPQSVHVQPARVLSLEYLRRTPSAGLLLVQLAGILLYPWMEASPRGRGLLPAVGLVLGVAVRVVRKSPWATWFALTMLTAKERK